VLRVDRARDGVALVVLNRPERLNALDGALFAELPRVSDELAGDETVRAGGPDWRRRRVLRWGGPCRRAAGPTATFSAPFARLGLGPDFAVSRLLPRTVGTLGMELILTGRTVGAEEALRVGELEPAEAAGISDPEFLERTAAWFAAKSDRSTREA